MRWMVIGVIAGCGGSSEVAAPKPSAGVIVAKLATDGVTAIFVGADRHAVTPDRATVVKVDPLPAEPPPMEVELDTVCGPRRVKARTTRVDRRESIIEVALAFDNPYRNKVDLWIDAPATAVVKVNKKVLKAPRSELSISCAEHLEVTLDDAPIGRLDGKSSQPVFITATKDRCYRFRNVVYGHVVQPHDGRRAPEETILRGEHVYRLAGKLDVFLEEAPEAIKSRISSGQLAQLQQHACP